VATLHAVMQAVNKSRLCNMLMPNESHLILPGYPRLIHNPFGRKDLCKISIDDSRLERHVHPSSLREREQGLRRQKTFEGICSEIIPGNRRTVRCSWRAWLPGQDVFNSGSVPGQTAHPFRRSAVARSRNLRTRNVAVGSD
jgi:hypothetical protein